MNLYICSTPYHLFVTLCMISNSNESSYIYMSTPDENVFNLFKKYKLKMANNLKIKEVFLRKRNNIKDRLFIERFYDVSEYRKIKSIVENSNVFIFPWHQCGLYSTSEYIFKKSKKVILVEDGGTSYAKEKPSNIERFVKKYIYFRDINFYKKEKIAKVLVQHPEKYSCSLFRNLEKLNLSSLAMNVSRKNKQNILNIFIEDLDLSMFKEDSVILLTQPLSEDGYVREEKKIDIYRNIIKKYTNNYNIIIKKHPRETTKYNFKGIQEISGDFPSEIFTMLGIKFEKAIGICTGAINLIDAKECINIDEEFFKKHQKIKY